MSQNVTSAASEITKNGTAENSITVAYLEQSRAMMAESKIVDDLDLEQSRAMMAESKTVDDLDLEQSRDMMAESKIVDDLNLKQSRAMMAESKTVNDLTIEQSRAMMAESKTVDDLELKQSRAMMAESKIVDDLDLESSRAIMAEYGIGVNLNTEISRATRQDILLTTSLTTEIGRAAFIRASDVGKAAAIDSTMFASITVVETAIAALSRNLTLMHALFTIKTSDAQLTANTAHNELSTLARCLASAVNQSHYNDTDGKGFRAAMTKSECNIMP